MKPQPATSETIWQWCALLAMCALIAWGLVHALDAGLIFGR